MQALTRAVAIFLIGSWAFPFYFIGSWIVPFFKGYRPWRFGKILLAYSALLILIDIYKVFVYGVGPELWNAMMAPGIFNIVFLFMLWGTEVSKRFNTFLNGETGIDGHIRGASIMTESNTAKTISNQDKNDDGSFLTIGGVRLAREVEPLSILLAGSPGTGKSLIFKWNVPVMRRRNDIIICADPNGDLMQSFYEDGDYILNPLDARGVNWSPLAEIEDDWECARIAKAIVPDVDGSSGEWANYAQSLLTAVIQKSVAAPNSTNGGLLDALTVFDNATLKNLVQGTPAAKLFSDGGKNTMIDNIRGIIGTELLPWSYLDRNAGKSAWSIGKYIQDVAEAQANGERVPALWIPYSSSQRALLRPLIGVWLDLISSSIMSLPPSRDRRIMLLIDELPALRKIGSLKETLAEGRKFGVCCIAGLQTVAQAQESYGREGSQALFACFQTTVTLRVTDPETAEYMSRKLGEGEFEEDRQSTSVDEEGNKTVSTQYHREVRRVVMPADIANLPERTGYLNVVGPDPIMPISIEVVSLEPVVEPFIKKARTV